uniref:Uncharacterized protein n=1 Tax=Anguilla anguilla TaxID=7936 RepID=A0A0E9XCY1_ANGAN
MCFSGRVYLVCIHQVHSNFLFHIFPPAKLPELYFRYSVHCS